MKNKQMHFEKNDKIQEYIISGQSIVLDILKRTWRKKIDESKEILDQIRDDKEYISKNIENVEKFLKDLNAVLDKYNELVVNKDITTPNGRELEYMRKVLENNYRIISFNYYKMAFDIINNEIVNNKQRNDKIEDQIRESLNTNTNLDTKIKQTKAEIGQMESRVEGLGATFLNIVLTISIVSSMVAVLINTKPNYAISIVLTSAWLLLSSILFISEYYKKSDSKKQSTFGIVVYGILSAVTLISFGLNIFFNEKNDYIDHYESRSYFLDNNSQNQKIIIDDNDKIENFVNHFKSYWKENDDKYSDDFIKDNKIFKIIVYKFTAGNINCYRYEIEFSNDTYITFKTDEDEFENWLKQNQLIM